MQIPYENFADMTASVGRPLEEEYDTQRDVERNPCGAHAAIQHMAVEITRLTRERDEALTQVAAAYEVAALVLDAYDEYDSHLCCDGRMCGCQGATVHQTMQHFIRALTPADAKDALDKLLRQARADGMRESAQICIDLRQGWPAPTILARATEIEEGRE